MDPVQNIRGGTFLHQQQAAVPSLELISQIHLLLTQINWECLTNNDQRKLKISELCQRYLGMENHATESTLPPGTFEKRKNALLDLALKFWLEDKLEASKEIAHNWNYYFKLKDPDCPHEQSELNYYRRPHLTGESSFLASVQKRADAGCRVAKEAMNAPKLTDMHYRSGLNPVHVSAETAYQQYFLLQTELNVQGNDPSVLPYLMEAGSLGHLEAIEIILNLNNLGLCPLRPNQVEDFMNKRFYLN